MKKRMPLRRWAERAFPVTGTGGSTKNWRQTLGGGRETAGQRKWQRMAETENCPRAGKGTRDPDVPQ